MKILNLAINSPKDACNLSCEFCFSHDLEGKLTMDDVKNILDKHPDATLVDLGSGGEPFLYNELVPMTKAITERGIDVLLSTNATIYRDDFFALDKKTLSKVDIQVSLHASNPELYKQITGKNLFEKVIENIKQFKQKNFTYISTSIYQRNYNDLTSLIQLTKKLDVPLRVNLVFPLGKGKNVDLLNKKQLNTIQGIITSQRINGSRQIDSSVCHIMNPCYAIEKFYGIKKQEPCHVDKGTKLYITPQASFPCEFYGGKINENS